MESFYSSDFEVMRNLAGFLRHTIGKPLYLVNIDQSDYLYDFEEYTEP